MARINPLFGRMKGKYGGSVMYSYNGKQCMRERVIEVRNPRSSKQAIQRAILATCGRFVSAFTPILNNSIQSETSKVKTLAKIRSYNMDYLRQLAAQNLGFYNRKGSVYVSPNDYIISRGDLQGINPLRSEAARLALDSGRMCIPLSELNSFDYSFTASQAFPSIAVGDQITILATYTADFSRTTTIVRYCRFAFKDDVTPVFVEPEEGAPRLNPAAVDLTKAEGDWRLLGFSDDAIGGEPVSIIDFTNFLGVDRVDMAGIIVSREADKKRSSAYMVSAIFDDDPDFLIDGVYPTYMAGSSNIEMPSDVYLDNDANVTPTPFAWITNVNGTPVVLPKSLNVSSTASTLCVLRGKNLPAAFSMQVKFSIEGSGAELTATFTNTTPGTTGGITFELDASNNISVTASVASTISAKSIRYYDGDGNDITWN